MNQAQNKVFLRVIFLLIHYEMNNTIAFFSIGKKRSFTATFINLAT